MLRNRVSPISGVPEGLGEALEMGVTDASVPVRFKAGEGVEEAEEEVKDSTELSTESSSMLRFLPAE